MMTVTMMTTARKTQQDDETGRQVCLRDAVTDEMKDKWYNQLIIVRIRGTTSSYKQEERRHRCIQGSRRVNHASKWTIDLEVDLFHFSL